MDKDRSHMTERILSLTLEIIYLLTGEDYVPASKSCGDVNDSSHLHVPEKLSQAKSPITELPHPSLIDKLKTIEKILDLTNKIIHLLTGEVPLRYEDIVVCFTMEEWEYLEGHKELYMSIINEQQESSEVADKSQPRITDGDDNEKNNGECGAQNQSIIPKSKNTCLPVVSIASNLSSHSEGATSHCVADISPEQTKKELQHIEKASTINEERHLKDSEPTVSSQPPGSEPSSQLKESTSGEDGHYEDSCFFTPAEQQDCKYIYVTENGSTHVSGSKLTLMTCRDCGDRFTVESDEDWFERGQPYMCRKCSSFNSGTDVREVPTAAISELLRTANLLHEDYEKGNVDRKKSFANKKLYNKKMNKINKTCSYPKWGGSFEDNASLNSYNIAPEEEKVFICSHCGKCFNHQASLELHQKTHMLEKVSFISPSGKYLRKKVLLKSHQLVHASGKHYNCSECGKSFKRSLSLVEHMQLHSRDKTLTCPECAQSFTQRSAYISHYKVHRDGKLHFCFECGKSFRTKADLTTHQRIHLGETPFPCPECGESFTRRANLVRHQRIHTGEKPFSCPDCGKCFTRKLGLMKHQKIHSGENVYKKGYRKNVFAMYRVIV